MAERKRFYVASPYHDPDETRCEANRRAAKRYCKEIEKRFLGAADLKRIYNAPTEQRDREVLDSVTAKWQEKYPRSMKRWYDNRDAITPIFKFSADVRTIIYTTNTIESLNSTYRKLNRQRSVFPGGKALLKALYLSTFEATKKWNMPIRNRGKAYGELSIMYDGRLPE